VARSLLGFRISRRFCSTLQTRKKTFWTNGTVTDRDAHYYVDRSLLAQTLAAALDAQTWPLVYGPRASGKSSLQLDIAQAARRAKYLVLPFDWYDLAMDSEKNYWSDMCQAVVASLMYHYLDENSNSDIPEAQKPAVIDSCHSYLKGDISSKNAFVSLFSPQYPLGLVRSNFGLKTILCGDGFSRLYDVYKDEAAKPAEKQKKHVFAIVEETLDTLRSLKNHRNALHAMIAFGTFSVFDPIKGKASPFDTKDRIAIPALTLDELQGLFAEFEMDHSTKLAPGIVEDIFRATAGHAGLVGVYGNVVANNKLNEEFVGLRESRERWEAFMSSPAMYEHIISFPGLLELIKAMIEQAPSTDAFQNIVGDAMTN